jgi:hypothetical protein
MTLTSALLGLREVEKWLYPDLKHQKRGLAAGSP